MLRILADHTIQGMLSMSLGSRLLHERLLASYCHLSVCLSVCLWQCVLCLNDISYSRNVWASDRKCPRRNTIIQLSTLYTQHISSKSPIPKFTSFIYYSILFMLMQIVKIIPWWPSIVVTVTTGAW